MTTRARRFLVVPASVLVLLALSLLGFRAAAGTESAAAAPAPNGVAISAGVGGYMWIVRGNKVALCNLPSVIDATQMSGQNLPVPNCGAATTLP